MVSVMREASSLDLSSSVHRSPWSRHTAQHLTLMCNFSLILSHVLARLPAEVSCLASLHYTDHPAPPGCVILLHPSLFQPTLPVSHLPQAIPCSEDPLIYLFPALICPPGPTFPLHSIKTVFKGGTYQLCPIGHTNALC